MLTYIIYKYVINARGFFRLDIGFVICEDEYVGFAADELVAVSRFVLVHRPK